MERKVTRVARRQGASSEASGSGGTMAKLCVAGATFGMVAAATLSVTPAAMGDGTHGRSPGAASKGATHTSGTSDKLLEFDPTAYTTLTVTIDGSPTKVRWYKEVCYVAKPTAVAASATVTNTACGYQSMNIYVPESAWDDQDAAIYFAVNNAGWMTSYVRAAVQDGQALDSSTSNVGAALKAGQVFANVATRSRGLVAADGSYAGKSPAVVVDGKAAIRYLRLNDRAMPGNAERIVVNGTSGGGGLGAIIGASGNNKDYYPYLQQVGAAGIDAKGRSSIRDDVFAVNLYCPITDLGNADAIYEWLFTVVGTRAADPRNNAQPAASAEIAAQFAAYEKSLGLTNPDGTPLTAATVLSQLKKEIAKSAETYMRAGSDIPDLGQTFTYPVGAGREVVFSNSSSVNDWLDVDNATDKVISVDIQKYLYFLSEQASLKPAPAFDRYGVLDKGVSNGTESTLFGTSSQLYFNYAPWSWANNNVLGDGSGTDDTGLSLRQYLKRSTLLNDQLKLINPMKYVDTRDSDAAPYWYVRVGTRDRDTAPIVSINLNRKLLQDKSIEDVNYHLAWMQPHAGNYDVPEATAWISKSLAAADSSLTNVKVTAGHSTQTVTPSGTKLAVTVPRGTRGVSLKAFATTDGATVRAPRAVRLSSRGSAKVKIVVTSDDRRSSTTYTLTVTTSRH
jgi:hypothetical protein